MPETEVPYGEIQTSAPETGEGNISPLLPVSIERNVTELPETEVGDFRVPEGEKVIRFPGSRVTFCCPSSVSVSVSDDYNVLVKEDDGTLYCIRRLYGSSYADAETALRYASDAFRSVPFPCNGKTYHGKQYDAGKIRTVSDPAGEIVNAHPSLAMTSDDSGAVIDILRPETAVSCRIVNGDAFMVVGISVAKDASLINDMTYEIIRSIKPYTPARSSAEVSFLTPYSVTRIAEILMPDGWVRTVDGEFSVFSPGENAGDFYAGTEVYIISDPEHRYSPDALGLPTGIGDIYTAHRYQTAEPYREETDVIDFDEIVQGGMHGYFYEVCRSIYPGSRHAVTDLPSCGTKLSSFEYTLTDPNGIPFLIGVSYTDKNRDPVFLFSRKLIDTVTSPAIR